MTTKRNTKQHQPMRAALYIRVSSEEQVDGYSLDAQDRAGRLYCAAHGWELVGIYRDEGKSAWTDDVDKRPEFARMISHAEAGLVDVIVVHKLDRFARNLLVTLETLQRLETSGVGFVSINENMDFTTPIGKVILATLAAFAQYYSDNLANEVRKGKRERKAQGLYNGLLPFGSVKGDDGLPMAHPTAHPGLVLAFELAAAGKTDREIARTLTAEGFRTTGNRGANPFAKDTVRALLQNRFYVGEIPDGNGGWLPAKHSPLIDPALFERAAAARIRNAKRPRRTKTESRTPWALSGLATCACGATMTAYGRSGSKQRVQCSRRTQTKDCDAPTFYAGIVEQQIGTFLQGFAVPQADRVRLVAEWKARTAGLRDVTDERKRIQRKLERLQHLYLEGDLDAATYRLKKAALAEQLAAIPSSTDDLAEAATERLASYLADLAQAWQVATPEERNKLARQMFNGVQIENRTAVAITPRPDLLPFFATLASETSSVMTHGRKRRGTVPQVQYQYGQSIRVPLPDSKYIGEPTSRDSSHIDDTFLPRRLGQRPRKLTHSDEATIRILSITCSLRALAVQFGVSHETIRKIIATHPSQE
jgi:site-specific DNA recombinase